MNKTRFAIGTSTVMAASFFLSGCQLLSGYQKIDEAENAQAWAGDILPVAGEVNIACVGTYHCEIVQIDKKSIIASNSHEPADPTMLAARPEGAETNTKRAIGAEMPALADKKSVKVVPLSASAIEGLTNYYARVLPAKREIHINFYPEDNLGYIERFAMIHDFTDAGIYQLRAYQNKSSDKAGSLLEAASPEPLCIELLQDDEVQRRFCKQLGSGEAQGEFVETGLGNKGTA
ncbi:hypothetical protein [Psychrobacter sp.]|uniref:hypothetical protein n=1 Tax=Psychrobacter sp. TaxID=56811 RepID=UPI003F998A0B